MSESGNNKSKPKPEGESKKKKVKKSEDAGGLCGEMSAFDLLVEAAANCQHEGESIWRNH